MATAELWRQWKDDRKAGVKVAVNWWMRAKFAVIQSAVDDFQSAEIKRQISSRPNSASRR